MQAGKSLDQEKKGSVGGGSSSRYSRLLGRHLLQVACDLSRNRERGFGPCQFCQFLQGFLNPSHITGYRLLLKKEEHDSFPIKKSLQFWARWRQLDQGEIEKVRLV